MNLTIEYVFVITIAIYAVVLAAATFWYARSGHQAAHENFPKAIKHITQGFVSIILFLLLFYLATKGILPKDVLITLVSVFATAGFLSFRNKD
jgi:hypothetical protein